MPLITRSEIYSELEHYFGWDDPDHHIDSEVPISTLFRRNTVTGIKALQQRLKEDAAEFHGVYCDWTSASPRMGIRDVKTFGNLVSAYVAEYRSRGWKVRDL